MRRPVFRKLLVFAAIALTAVACGSSTTTTPTTPTTPTPTTTTETFTGTLTLNGAASYSFTVAAAGTITATLTSLGPGSALTVGISLGTWNGTACQLVIANDNAAQGTIVTGSVSASGSLCARIYDAAAKLTDPLPYTVTVVHP